MDATATGFDDSPLRFDQLVLAINEGERLLGVPYPSPSVTVRRVAEVLGGFCGKNEMSYAPRYVGDPYVVDGSVISIRVDEDCDETFGTIVHEVAHSWFFGNDPADWIDEGLANAVELQVVAANQKDKVIYPPVTYCEDYRNISELEQSNPARISEEAYTGFRCNYSLGDGIFGALKELFGDTEFNKHITQLARRETNISDSPYTIDDIRKVLGDEELALDLVSLWYDGQPEMRTFRHLDAVTWTFPPTSDGEHLHFAGKIDPTQTGTVHDFSLGDDPYCSQFPLYEGIGDLEWVGSVTGPLPAGWSHDEDSKIVTINHHINPETGEFQVTARILDDILRSDSDFSLMVRSRVTTGADGLCQQGTIYSHVAVLEGEIPSKFKAARFYHLDAVEWTHPPTIDGGYLHFSGVTREPGMVHDFVLGDDRYCSQFVLYRGVVDQEWVASVSDPLPVRWIHSEIPKVVVTNHQTDPVTGEFSITAKINDQSLASMPDLSLLVRRRALVGPNRTCGRTDDYSQVPVVLGDIPTQLKTARHYHLDAIQWTNLPTIVGNTLRFAGNAAPGAVRLTWEQGHCGQVLFYEHNEKGYHYIDSINPFLPGNRSWATQVEAEVVERREDADGYFEAVVHLSDNVLAGYHNPVLVVTTLSSLDSITNRCGRTDVLSAEYIRRP